MITYSMTRSGVLLPDDDPRVRPVYDEIATLGDGRDITRGWVSGLLELAPQDALLAGKGGGDYTFYKQVASDWQVKSVWQQRQQALIGAEWLIEPGGPRRQDKAAADWLRETLVHVGWDRVTEKAHWAAFYGFGTAECLYARDGERVMLDQVKVRDRRRFLFDATGALRLRTLAQPQGEPLPPRKFWTVATGADHDDEPYGLGLAHWLYWPVLFKRAGIKFWLIGLEKFASPTAIGWYPANLAGNDEASKRERGKLLASLRAIQLDSAVALPEGMRAELLQANRSGGGDYAALCEYMDRVIARVVVGQTLTSDASKSGGGSQALGRVHQDVMDGIVKADADLLCESFNRGPVRWLCEWNWPNAAPPRVYRRTEPPADRNAQAERDRKIFEIGYRPTLAQVVADYGGDWEAVPPAAPAGAAGTVPAGTAPPPAEFAEAAALAPDQRALDAAVATLAPQLQPLAEALLAPLLARLESAASYEEAIDALGEALPAMNLDQLAELLARGGFAAGLHGRLSVQAEHDAGG